MRETTWLVANNSRREGLSLSYGSYIYNYLCNQFLSTIKLWVRIPLMARCTRYSIFCQWLATG